MIDRFSLYLAALLATGSVFAQENQSVSALGRLEPANGVIRVSASSTPQAILGAILVELHVDEGDDVEKGQLRAVTDTAAVMNAQVAEAEAGDIVLRLHSLRSLRLGTGQMHIKR